MMKVKVTVSLLAIPMAFLALPSSMLAQSSDVRPRNKNYSAKFKSGTLRGSGNQIQSNSIASFIGGGQSNVIFNGLTNCFIGGGFGNIVSNHFGTVAGGLSNTASGPFSAIGGGSVNTASGLSATVDGGEGNAASDSYATVGGGLSNTANLAYATVGGGMSNTASGNYATISGGGGNTISLLRWYTTIAGGWGNTVSGDYASIVGGAYNTASGTSATVGGGFTNTASGYRSAAGGGVSNTVSGDMATVPGGSENTASGGYSFAGGRRAKATNVGCFVWADSRDADFASGGANQFLVRAEFTGINRNAPLTLNEVFGITAPETDDYGGMYVRTVGAAAKPFYGYSVNGAADAFTYVDGADARKWKLYTGGNNRITVTVDGNVGIGTTTPVRPLQMASGAYVSEGGVWTDVSDANRKQNFRPVDSRAVLAKVVSLPVTKWNYIAEPGVDHIGPMAQDFHAAFGLGNDDKAIGSVDRDGVMYAAIQGLVEELRERDKAIEELKSKLQDFEQRLNALPPVP